MINIMKHACIGIMLLLISLTVPAQQQTTVKGKVLDAVSKQPIANAQVSSPGAKESSLTEKDGSFSIKLTNKNERLSVNFENYLESEIMLLGRNQITIFLLPKDQIMSSEFVQTSEGPVKRTKQIGTAFSINKKDLGQAYSAVDDALVGKMAGLQVTNKSGMPGEGSLVKMRGLRSLVAENTPLIVVDGVPCLPDLGESSVINGFSKNIFAAVNLKDIESVTLLKGMDAAAYGSMGSNGVLLIETEKASDLETKVQFHTVEGISVMNKRYPLLGDEDFKSYIADVGETAYSDLNLLVDVFPFLKDNPDDHYKYVYDNNTKWQDEIYTPAFSSENILKVKGGDAIAKYALSVGYLYNKGVVEKTQQSKYYTRLNADVNITKRFKVFATVGFNYGDHKLMEQGMAKETNPLLTAMQMAPLLSVYEQDSKKNNLPNFNPIRQFGISNPKAVVSDVDAVSKSYDVLISVGANYRHSPFLNFGLQGGLYYNYTKEDMFIPGKTSEAIAPLLGGIALNTVRSGTNEGMNYYLKGGVQYDRTFNYDHEVAVAAGYQLMTSRRELDCGSGINTNSDFYRELGNVNSANNRKIIGYIDQWNWMNGYVQGTYGFRNQYYVGVSASLDAASSYGENSGRVFVMPAVKAAWKAKNASFLRDNEWISDLTIRGEYGKNGNSRYSSKYGRYYYTSVPLRDAAGIIRAGLPNAQLKPEKNITATIGADIALIGNRVTMGVNLFQEQTKDMLLDREMPAFYGFNTRYDNTGELKTKGVEVNFTVNLLNKKGFNWMVGGNIASYKSEVVSLGELNARTVHFSDGARLYSKVGEAPNLFYGHVANGVYASRQQATAAGIYSHGGLPFEAGDMIFEDRVIDNVINDADMTVIGDPTPDFYGGFYTNLSYKGFNLYANFTYSYGNDIYNAVRRSAESMSGFENQSAVVARRWTSDGQVTDLPKANFGDPIGNSRFSSRWIEDGSYLKLKEITLSYDIDQKVLFFNRLKVYVTGENLFTATKYLGLDPETGYSYDPELSGMDLGKMPLAKTAKVGLILNF